MPFACEEELKEKADRLNLLNIELNLDGKDTPIMDTEPEQETEPPEKKTPGRAVNLPFAHLYCRILGSIMGGDKKNRR